MNIIINPGTGPVENANEQNAVVNMQHFITDCNVEGISFVRVPQHDYGDGRYCFLVWKGTRCHEIQMPGCSLSKVRFMGQKEQYILDYPRLYVDSNSEVWNLSLLRKPDDFKEEL